MKGFTLKRCLSVVIPLFIVYGFSHSENSVSFTDFVKVISRQSDQIVSVTSQHRANPYNIFETQRVSARTGSISEKMLLSDVGVTEILRPNTSEFKDVRLKPRARITNFGSLTQSFGAVMKIRPGGYTSYKNVQNLIPGNAIDIEFDEYITSNSGSHTATAFTYLEEDSVRQNDTCTKEFVVTAEQQNHVLLEYCSGTWCQWCPCGHTVAQQILNSYPGTVVLCYHGGGTDPWQIYSAGIRSMLGLNSYPTGVVGRRSDIIYRSQWYATVAAQSALIPTVNIEVVSKQFNSQTRQYNAELRITSNVTLSGDYYLCCVLTEDSLIYAQTGNSSCPGGTDYVHKDVVKSMMNGDAGELISSGTWNSGTSITRILNVTIPEAPQITDLNFTNLNVFVYKLSGSLVTESHIQQALKTELLPEAIGLRLELKAYGEGLYDSYSQLMISDSLKVYLRMGEEPYSLIDSSLNVLDMQGRGTFQFLSGLSGVTYYLVLCHKNSIETWSAEPVTFFSGIAEYDFTDSRIKAYGDNLLKKGNRYCIYTGDVNRDFHVDGSDIQIIDMDIFNFAMGFSVSDLNSDLIVDGEDALIADNNALNMVSTKSPLMVR